MFQAIDVHEPEKFDKCQGIEGADIPPEKDYESPAEELRTEGMFCFTLDVKEHRSYRGYLRLLNLIQKAKYSWPKNKIYQNRKHFDPITLV